MRPTESLKEEHRVIERMTRVMETVSDKLKRGEDVPPGDIEKIIDFIRTFADSCHHHKEEDLLYVRAEERGIPRDGGPIGVMLDEHEMGREYVRGMADALPKYAGGDEDARSALSQNAWAYGNLLSQHIGKENNILYPMIDNFLTEDDQAEMLEKFHEVEHERIGEGRHREYIALVEKLEAEYPGSPLDAE